MNATCPKCHQPLRPAARFCASCGAGIEAPVPQPTVRPTTSQSTPFPAGARNNLAVRLTVASILIVLLGVGDWLFVSHRAADARLTDQFFAAIKSGDDITVEGLYYQHKNLLRATQDGLPPIIFAERVKQPGIVKFLVSVGENVDDRDNAGNTVLLYASGSGELDLVQYLLENGANPSVHSSGGMIPLASAEMSVTFTNDSAQKARYAQIVALLKPKAKP